MIKNFSLKSALWRLCFLTSGVIAFMWILSMPGGFPNTSLHFWVKNLIMPLGLLISITFFYFSYTKNDKMILIHRTGLLGFLLGIGISAKIVFPITFGVTSFLILSIGFGLIFCTVLKDFSQIKLRVYCACLLGAALPGIILTFSQRGLPAQTEPFDVKLETVEGEDKKTVQSFYSENFRFDSVNQGAKLSHGESALQIYPVLTFNSMSPDKCWTIFSPLQYFSPPQMKLMNWRNESGKITCNYTQNGQHTVSLSAQLKEESLFLESRVKVPFDAYSMRFLCLT